MTFAVIISWFCDLTQIKYWKQFFILKPAKNKIHNYKAQENQLHNLYSLFSKALHLTPLKIE